MKLMILVGFLFSFSSYCCMPFKVGFEFQLNGEMCKKALENYSVQKFPIFRVNVKDNPSLFHVELDGPDIEFVTRPFSNECSEKENLETCMALIALSVNKIEELTNNSNKKTTLKMWKESLASLGSNIEITEEPIFGIVANYDIIRPSLDLKIAWQPQVTLQHPLRYTINLLDSLFYGTLISEMNIKEAKPFYNPVSIEKKPLYNTAVGGLIFLLAHEMSGINKSTIYQPAEVLELLLKRKYVKSGDSVSDSDMIADTWESFQSVHQFDAKRRVIFMSRRPFSDMFKDILVAKSEITSDKESLDLLSSGFAPAFEKAMSVNMFFQTRSARSEKEPRILIRDTFFRSNYAEQFFDDTGVPLDLNCLADYFTDVQTPSTIELLKKGILSTSMLRHMNLKKAVATGVMSEKAASEIEIIQSPNLYDIVLETIERPVERSFLRIKKTEKPVFIDALPETSSTKETNIVSDRMSPLFPLDQRDAMGFFREDSYSQEIFGSAIVEIRAIQHVKFLSKSSKPSTFLSSPMFVVEEAKVLYEWLHSFKN